MAHIQLAFSNWGHFLIGFYFAFFGLWNIYHWTPFLAVLARKNFPHAYLILAIGIAFQFTAGILIIFNIFIKLTAFFLALFTLIAIFIFHDFWNFTGESRRLHFTLFMTNLTVTLGALFLLI